MSKNAASVALDTAGDDAARLGALIADQVASMLDPAVVRTLLEHPEGLHDALLRAAGRDPTLERRAEPALDPDEARRRLVAACVPSVGAEAIDGLGAADLARRLGLGSRQTVYDRAARGELVGFDVAAGRRFPLAQFDERGCVLPGIADVLTTLGDPWATWLWLTRPVWALGGAVPLERLRREGDEAVADVNAAARAERDGHYQ